MSWTNFNDAEDQRTFPLIPKGTLTKVRMTIRPGGFDDPQQGWTGGYATRNEQTGSVYLSAEFVVLEGEYARQRLWSLIGLYSAKGPEWGHMGRSFIKGVLNSARGLHPDDHSEAAKTARCIHDFSELDGIEFVAKVDVEKDQYDGDRNVIKTAITPEHRDYAAVMGNAMVQALLLPSSASAPVSQAATPSTVSPSQSIATTPNVSTGRPSWAQ